MPRLIFRAARPASDFNVNSDSFIVRFGSSSLVFIVLSTAIIIVIL